MVCAVQSSDLPKCTRHQGRTHHGLSAVGEGDGDHGDQHSKLVRAGELLQVGVERKLVRLLP